jgi:hypothetical protein
MNIRFFIFAIAFLVAGSAKAQIIKGAGIIYFDSLVNASAQLPNGSELAYSIKLKKLYRWNRTALAWEDMVPDTSQYNELQLIYVLQDTLYLTNQIGGIPLTPYKDSLFLISGPPDTLRTSTGYSIVLDYAKQDTSGYNTAFYRSGDTIYLQDGNSTKFIVLPSGSVDTDDQTLSLSGDTLRISEGNYVLLSAFRDTTNLSFSGAIGPIALQSSTGSDVQFDDGVGTNVTQSGGVLYYNLNSVGTPGTYTSVTTDAYGRVISGNNSGTSEFSYILPSYTPAVQAYVLSDTDINVWWTKESADKYTLQRDTFSDFSTAVTIYAGADTVFSDTGLTPGIRYYYRVKSYRENSAPSDWGTCNAMTLRDYLFWGELSQLKSGISNRYVNVFTSAQIDTIYSAVSNNTFNVIGNFRGSLTVNLTKTAGAALGVGVFGPFQYTANDSISLTGDFSIMLKLIRSGTNTSTILSNTAGTELIQIYLKGQGLVVQEQTGESYNIIDSDTIAAQTMTAIVLQREGTTYRLSKDLGATWVSVTNANIGGALNLVKFLSADNYYQRVVIDNRIWGEDEIKQIADF